MGHEEESEVGSSRVHGERIEKIVHIISFPKRCLSSVYAKLHLVLSASVLLGRRASRKMIVGLVTTFGLRRGERST